MLDATPDIWWCTCVDVSEWDRKAHGEIKTHGKRASISALSSRPKSYIHIKNMSQRVMEVLHDRMTLSFLYCSKIHGRDTYSKRERWEEERWPQEKLTNGSFFWGKFDDSAQVIDCTDFQSCLEILRTMWTERCLIDRAMKSWAEGTHWINAESEMTDRKISALKHAQDKDRDWQACKNR